MIGKRSGKVAGSMYYLRAGTRIPVALPAQVHWKDREGNPVHAQGRTACISGNGLFITAPVRLRQETPVTITVSLPVEFTKTPLELKCQARVVRQKRPGKAVGIGAIIDDYSFRPLRPA